MDLNILLHKLKQFPRHGASGEGGGTLPTVNTLTVITKTGGSVTLRGSSANGDAEKGIITRRGFRFSTSATPPATTYVNVENNPTSATSYTLLRSGLDTGRLYYYQAQVETAPALEGGSNLITLGTIRSERPLEVFANSGQISLKALKDTYDSPQSDSNISFNTLFRVAVVQKDNNIGFSDFYGHSQSPTSFYRGGNCGGTTSIQTWHSGTDPRPYTSDRVFTADCGGRANLIANGTYGIHSSGGNGQSVTSTFTTVNGTVTETILCTGGNDNRTGGG